MTLYEKLIAAGLPIAGATEQGEISGLPGTIFTDAQNQTMVDIILEHFKPAEYTALLAWRIDVQQLRDDYLAAIARLEQIENATTFTTNQVIAAIQDMAKYERLILKLLRRQYNGG